jgi:hypothetical protein
MNYLFSSINTGTLYCRQPERSISHANAIEFSTGDLQSDFQFSSRTNSRICQAYYLQLPFDRWLFILSNIAVWRRDAGEL